MPCWKNTRRLPRATNHSLLRRTAASSASQFCRLPHSDTILTRLDVILISRPAQSLFFRRLRTFSAHYNQQTYLIQ